MKVLCNTKYVVIFDKVKRENGISRYPSLFALLPSLFTFDILLQVAGPK
jgi:hypothetical protein